ncbi:MAG: hypothetical protein ABI612_12380 [Betaproteobacteria bacterium]
MERPPYDPAPPYASNVPAHTVEHHASLKRISWAAVLAGVILAMVLQLLLSMLGTGIGMSTIDPLQGDGTPSVANFGVGAGIWWVISSLIALYIGGWVAGHLAGVPRAMDGALHGLLTWGLATLVSLYLLGSAVGSLISGAGNILGTAASVAGQGVAAVAPHVTGAAKDQLAQSGISWDSIKEEAQKLLAQTGKPALQPSAIDQQAKAAVADAKQAGKNAAATPSDANQDIGALLDRLFSRGQATASQVDRDAVINVLVARTGMSRADAAKRVQDWEATYQQMRAKAEQASEQAKQKVREAADATAKAVSRATLWGFFALVLGGLAAAWGGMAGRPRTAIS